MRALQVNEPSCSGAESKIEKRKQRFSWSNQSLFIRRNDRKLPTVFISAIVGIFIWTLFAILVAAIGRNSGSELISVIFTLIAFLGAFHAMEIIPDAPSKYDYAEKFELILFSVFIIFGPAIGGITAYYLFWK